MSLSSSAQQRVCYPDLEHTGSTSQSCHSFWCRCGAQLQVLCAKGNPSREDTTKMLESLRWAERIVVTGEALMQRLLGRRQLVQRLLESCIDDVGSSHTGHRPAQGLHPTTHTLNT